MTSGSMRATSGLLLALLFLCVGESHATATEPLYVIAVGYNGLPPQSSQSSGEGFRELRFADDDAVAVDALFKGAATALVLLTTIDPETRRKYPEVDDAGPPTLAELRAAVQGVARRMAADRRAGTNPSAIFFYSGHGFSSSAGAALALQGGALTTQALYDEVIAPLSVGQLHVLVDACHAESVVRPRDLQAGAVDVAPAEARAYVQSATLARYPGVGAIVATTGGAQAHEWDAYGAGVFTHELLSGLRGGADVNGDGRVEYTEMAAFLAAANREVADPRARLQAVVQFPRGNARAPLIDSAPLLARMGRLRGRAARLGSFYIEDDRGVRLLDLHAERGFGVTLLLPASQTLFVRTRDAEARIVVAAGETLSLDHLSFEPSQLTARGALESALRHGLFGSSFGPGYYLGYSDRSTEGAPVMVKNEIEQETPAPPSTLSHGGLAWLSTGAAVALSAAALATGAAALSSYRKVQHTSLEGPARAALDQYVGRRNLSLALGAGAALAGTAAVVLWRWRPTSTDVTLTAHAQGLALSSVFP